MSDPIITASPLERGTHEDTAAGAVERTFTPPTIVTSQANQRASIFEQVDIGLILGELTDTTKVWYKSKVILSAIAALIMLALTQFDALPSWVTQDNIVEFALIAIPIIGTILARFGATDRVVAKQPPTLEGNDNGNS